MKIFMAVCLFIVNISNITIAKDRRFRVTDFGDNFQITSPFGSKAYIGDIGISDMRSYRFEIPIADLKPILGGYMPIDDNQRPDKKTQEKYTETEEELILQANHLYGQGKFKESLAFIEEALRRNNKNVRAWIMKGSLMHLQGQKDLGKIYWKKALKLDPDNEQIKRLAGE